MSRPGGIFKQDAAARRAWGEAFDAVPKSEPGAAEGRMIEELEALRDGGHLPAAQADRAIKAIRRGLA